MKPLGNLAAPFLPGRGERTLTPEEQAEVDLVLDRARLWVSHGGSVQQAATVGALAWNGQPSPAYSRFVALHSTPASDPRRGDLVKLIDRLISLTGYVRTEQGMFNPTDLGEHDVPLRWRRTSDQPDPWR